MSTIEQIEKAVQSLSGPELERFRVWFANYDQANRDAELSRRAEEIRSSIHQHEEGKSRDGFVALDEMKGDIGDRFQA